MTDVLYVLLTSETDLVLSWYLSFIRLTDLSIMTPAANSLGEFFIGILHYGSYSFMISFGRVGIAKKRVIVRAIDSRFHKFLE
jgi:hypothetical protein